MRLSAHKPFHESLERMTSLYAATIHSYSVLYDEGRRTLKQKGKSDSKLEFKLDGLVIQRPLKVVTFHARDVYPELLRATLLVRLVSTYEAFLVDTLREIAARNSAPFTTDEPVAITQPQLLELARSGELEAHLLERRLRPLTSGGLSDIRKFYLKTVKFDILAPTQTLGVIEEIHDRRHLYVHRMGYADAQYCKKYGKSPVSPDERVPVSEKYMLGAFAELRTSALFIKKEAESKFPTAPEVKYFPGKATLAEIGEPLLFLKARSTSEAGKKFLSDDTHPLKTGILLQDITVWRSQRENAFRMLLKGNAKCIQLYFKMLQLRESADELQVLESFKIKRD
jgi:hypothetical protein